MQSLKTEDVSGPSLIKPRQISEVVKSRTRLHRYVRADHIGLCEQWAGLCEQWAKEHSSYHSVEFFRSSRASSTPTEGTQLLAKGQGLVCGSRVSDRHACILFTECGKYELHTDLEQ